MIDKTAIIDQNAKVHPTAKIGPYVVIGPNVEIGENVKIYSHVSIAGNTKIGKGNVFSNFPHCLLGISIQPKMMKTGMPVLKRRMMG